MQGRTIANAVAVTALLALASVITVGEKRHERVVQPGECWPGPCAGKIAVGPASTPNADTLDIKCEAGCRGGGTAGPLYWDMICDGNLCRDALALGNDFCLQHSHLGENMEVQFDKGFDDCADIEAKAAAAASIRSPPSRE